MKLKEIKRIGDRISRKHGVHYGEGVICDRYGLPGETISVEVRTELVSYGGGNEFLEEVKNRLGYDGYNLGGCVYRFFEEG